jgi:CheY-like chemotaxis protein
MRRILIVADRLLGGAELRERLALKKSTDPDVEVFVLVPQRAGQDSTGVGPGPPKSADEMLQLELAMLGELQYKVEGAVGDADPLSAVRNLLKERQFDEIILATPPTGVSRWVRMDLSHRMERVTKLPVDHLAGEQPAVAEETLLTSVPFKGVPAAASPGEPVRVLLVEDDEADAELTRLALARCPTPSTIDVVGDGAQAVEWLRSAGGEAGADLVLVDLKMPIVDGFELLERLRTEHDLDQLAVVVLTTSSRMEDRERAHALGAHGYVTKETSFPMYRDLLEGLLEDVARS